MRATNRAEGRRGPGVDLAVVEGAAPDPQVREVLHGDDVADRVEAVVARGCASPAKALWTSYASASWRARSMVSGQPSPNTRTQGSDCLSTTPGTAGSERTMNTRLRLPSPTSRTVSGPVGTSADRSGARPDVVGHLLDGQGPIAVRHRRRAHRRIAPAPAGQRAA